MRSKTSYVEGEKNGRKVYQKAGMQAEQRDGLEYEFTVVLDVVHDGNLAMASKDRTNLFRDPQIITEKTGKALLDWLNSAAAQAPAPRASAPPPPAPEHTGGVLPQENFVAHTSALKASLTPEQLGEAWAAAKVACQAVGDVEAYNALKIVMQNAADAIKSRHGAEA